MNGAAYSSHPNKTRPLRLALLNDFEIVVNGLSAMLEPFNDRVHVVTEELGMPDLQDHPIDIALLDTYGMPQYGTARIDKLVDDPLVRRAVLFTWDLKPDRIDDALARGASGILSKASSAHRLVTDLERIGQGEVVVSTGDRGDAEGRRWPARANGLSERESQVLALLITGRRNIEIAEALFLSPDTVKSHLRSVFRKIGVRNRTEAVAFALRDESFRRRESQAVAGS